MESNQPHLPDDFDAAADYYATDCTESQPDSDPADRLGHPDDLDIIPDFDAPRTRTRKTPDEIAEDMASCGALRFKFKDGKLVAYYERCRHWKHGCQRCLREHANREKDTLAHTVACIPSLIITVPTDDAAAWTAALGKTNYRRYPTPEGVILIISADRAAEIGSDFPELATAQPFTADDARDETIINFKTLLPSQDGKTSGSLFKRALGPTAPTTADDNSDDSPTEVISLQAIVVPAATNINLVLDAAAEAIRQTQAHPTTVEEYRTLTLERIGIISNRLAELGIKVSPRTYRERVKTFDIRWENSPESVYALRGQFVQNWPTRRHIEADISTA